MQEEKTFEASMDELELIVKQLEDGNIPLDQMIALYERGANLGKQLMKQLESYEGKVETLNAMLEDREEE